MNYKLTKEQLAFDEAMRIMEHYDLWVRRNSIDCFKALQEAYNKGCEQNETRRAENSIS